MSESEIRALSTRRAEQIHRMELDEMASGFYATEATLMPSAAATVRGIDAIREFWRDTPSNGLVSLTLETQAVDASDDLAYEMGRFNRTLRPRHGAPFQEHGKYVVVYRRAEDGSWRAVAEIFNSDAPR